MNSCKRKRSKKQRRKEKYTHLNAEFQRIARRDKKAFLSHQCREIEENNQMGKNRDLFKKIRDTKGTFPAKMDTIKDRNGMNLTETEDNKKRSLVFSILLFSSISFHCSLRKAFLSLLAILWNSAFRWVYLSFPPLSFASLLFSAIF